MTPTEEQLRSWAMFVDRILGEFSEEMAVIPKDLPRDLINQIMQTTDALSGLAEKLLFYLGPPDA